MFLVYRDIGPFRNDLSPEVQVVPDHYNSNCPGTCNIHCALLGKEPMLGVFEAIASDTHEEVLFGHDPVSGLKAIIAIHSTALGPALGGTRFFPYESEEAALCDVLRLG